MGISLASLLAMPKAHLIGCGVVIGVGSMTVGAAKLSNHFAKNEKSKHAMRINLFMKVFLMSTTFLIFFWLLFNNPFILMFD